MKRRRFINLALFLAVGVTLMLASAAFITILRPGFVTSEAVLKSGTATIGGPFVLAATDGQNVSDQTFRGKWVLIYFGYTYCPDACPAALNSISVALEKLGAATGNLQPLFVTIDPARDTREVMADYLKSFDSRILGLTGTDEQIDGVIKEFRLYVSQARSDAEGDGYVVSHSSYIYLMDPQGRFVDVIPGNATGQEIALWLRNKTERASS